MTAERIGVVSAAGQETQGDHRGVYRHEGGDESAVQAEIRRMRDLASFLNRESKAFWKGAGLRLEEGRAIIMGVGSGAEIPNCVDIGAGEVIGIDRDPAVIEVAKRQYAQFAQLDGRLTLKIGDIMNLKDLDLPQASLIVDRLVLQYTPSSRLPETVSQQASLLINGGVLSLEDFEDVPNTWTISKPCRDFDALKAGVVEIYRRTGTSCSLGHSLESLCQQAGLRVIKTRSYSISSDQDPGSKETHLGILSRARAAMVKLGIVSNQEEFDGHFQEVERTLMDPEVVATIPRMVQVLAVKS